MYDSNEEKVRLVKDIEHLDNYIQLELILVKPVRYERFKKSVDRCIEFIQSKKLDVPPEKNESKTTISFKSGTSNIIIPLIPFPTSRD